MYMGAIQLKYRPSHTFNNNKMPSTVENDFAHELSSKEEVLHNKIKEMKNNIETRNVDFEPRFQVGIKTYTQEEWDKLLEYVDEVEEETREALEVEQAMNETVEK